MSLIIEPDAESGRGRRWCEIENDFAALRKRLDLKNVSFSNLRDTSSTKVESIDRTLTDLFDGHKDGRMARFYIDGSKIDYDQMFGRLDRAIDELGLYYELKLATKALSSCSQRRQAHSTTEGLVTSYSLGANIRQAGKITSRFSGMPLFTLGGAVARVPEDATAFPGRSAQHNLNIVGA